MSDLCLTVYCGHHKDEHYTKNGCEVMVKDGMKKYHMCKCKGFNGGKGNG